MLPGHVVRELVQNDRVIGGLTPRCSEAACALYELFVQGECHSGQTPKAAMPRRLGQGRGRVGPASYNAVMHLCSNDVAYCFACTQRSACHEC
ncbi:hypothetical protein ACM26W_11820 [Halomonas sp. HK25]|uniref:hypothetical protein n=1 Tax=Halomonas sp. HK25 TaxID=3394321 RepID=UPI0039FD28D1